MKLFIEYEKDEIASNIGFAKALTECFSNEADLHEIANYLMIYSNARANEKLANPYGELKGGEQE